MAGSEYAGLAGSDSAACRGPVPGRPRPRPWTGPRPERWRRPRRRILRQYRGRRDSVTQCPPSLLRLWECQSARVDPGAVTGAATVTVTGSVTECAQPHRRCRVTSHESRRSPGPGGSPAAADRTFTKTNVEFLAGPRPRSPWHGRRGHTEPFRCRLLTPGRALYRTVNFVNWAGITISFIAIASTSKVLVNCSTALVGRIEGGNTMKSSSVTPNLAMYPKLSPTPTSRTTTSTLARRSTSAGRTRGSKGAMLTEVTIPFDLMLLFFVFWLS